jgi:hypothetical protein
MQHDATGRAGGSPSGDAGADRQSLAPLGSLPGFKLAADEPDIRGWDVLSVDGRRLGVIDELLVDTRTDEISALAVRLGDGLVAMPMSDARIDTRMRAVFAEAPERLAAMPRGAAGAGAASTQGASRVVQATPQGHQQQPQPQATAHTGITVERTASGEEIVRVPIVEEELVVERRPVVKEVVVIRKRAVEEQHVVEADLRRERLEVDRRDQR